MREKIRHNMSEKEVLDHMKKEFEAEKVSLWKRLNDLIVLFNETINLNSYPMVDERGKYACMLDTLCGENSITSHTQSLLIQATAFKEFVETHGESDDKIVEAIENLSSKIREIELKIQERMKDIDLKTKTKKDRPRRIK